MIYELEYLQRQNNDGSGRNYRSPSIKNSVVISCFCGEFSGVMKKWEDIFSRIQKADFLLVYFSTPHCNVCKSLLPKVKDLIKNYPELDFVYIDIETYPQIAGQFLVFVVPTLIFFSREKELQRFSRFVSITDLRNFIERYRKLLQSENE